MKNVPAFDGFYVLPYLSYNNTFIFHLYKVNFSAAIIEVINIRLG